MRGKGEPVCFFSGRKVLERIHYLKGVKLGSKREGPEAAGSARQSDGEWWKPAGAPVDEIITPRGLGTS